MCMCVPAMYLNFLAILISNILLNYPLLLHIFLVKKYGPSAYEITEHLYFSCKLLGDSQWSVKGTIIQS